MYILYLIIIMALSSAPAHAQQVVQLQNSMPPEEQISPLLKRRYEALLTKLVEQTRTTSELSPQLETKTQNMKKILSNVGARHEATTLKIYILKHEQKQFIDKYPAFFRNTSIMNFLHDHDSSDLVFAWQSDCTLQIWEKYPTIVQLTAAQIQFVEKTIRTQCLNAEHALFLTLPWRWQNMLEDEYGMPSLPCVIS